MRTRSNAEPEPSLRFLDQPETIATLAAAENLLAGLNDQYDDLSYDLNSKLSSHPYEGTTLFTFDTPFAPGALPANDRASAILHKTSYALENSRRLDFTSDSVVRRRVILSQTALGAALKEDRTPTFRTSHMNPMGQILFTHPLIVDEPHLEEPIIGAVTLSYTINQEPRWTYPTQDAIEAIWDDNKKETREVARALAALAQKTPSLSRSLEIAPPITSNAYVIQVGVCNAERSALSNNYAIFDAYTEALQVERERITERLNVQIVNHVNGETIIVPLSTVYNLNSAYEVNTFGRRVIQPLIAELTDAHERVAKAFYPHLFPRIAMAVGLGVIEEDKNNNPTGKVLWDVARVMNTDSDGVRYTDSAQRALFGEINR